MISPMDAPVTDVLRLLSKITAIELLTARSPILLFAYNFKDDDDDDDGNTVQYGKQKGDRWGRNEGCPRT